MQAGDMRSLLFLIPLLLLGSLLPTHAGGKKQDMAGISFHMETEPGENPKMVFPQVLSGKERYFRRVPEVTAKDLKAFRPFEDPGGAGYGVLVELKPGAVNRLAGVTAANTGKWLLARVNGNIVDAVKIDKQITDGKLVIWKGISQEGIVAMDKILPRIGEQKPRR